MFGSTHKSVEIDFVDTVSEAQSIRHVLDELSQSWSWVTFECKDSDHVIEIAHDQDYLTLNIPHEEKKGLTPRLHESGFTLPESWTITKDQVKRFLQSGFFEVRIPSDQTPTLSGLVREIGIKLCGWTQHGTICATFQK